MSSSLSLSGTLNILIQMNSYDIWLGKVSCQQGVECFFKFYFILYISVHLVARLSVFLVSFGSFMHLSYRI